MQRSLLSHRWYYLWPLLLPPGAEDAGRTRLMEAGHGDGKKAAGPALARRLGEVEIAFVGIVGELHHLEDRVRLFFGRRTQQEYDSLYRSSFQQYMPEMRKTLDGVI